MSQSPDEGHSVPLPASRSWARIWLAALTKPSVQTYEAIANDANATLQRALRWLFFSYLISGVGLVGSFFSPRMVGRVYVGSWIPLLLKLFHGSLLGVICAVTLHIVTGLILLLVLYGIVHLALRRFGRNIPFPKFAFAQA